MFKTTCAVLTAALAFSPAPATAERTLFFEETAEAFWEVLHTCADGSTVPADLVVVGIGIIANDDLARAAGLACDRGIVVDALLRTADPDIYAIGDCAAFPHPMADGLVRLESVQNAIDQGKTVADAIMGDAKPYAAVPWFWSDQYDRKIQFIGRARPHDEVVIVDGSLADRQLTALYRRGDRVVACLAVNQPRALIKYRKLLAAGISWEAALSGTAAS